MKNQGYDVIREQVFSDRLPNGLPVFVIKKSGYNKTFAFFATNYGGADRRFRYSGEWTDTPEGVAHFLEHKMFDTEDGNALADLSANGAQPNAFTSTDITAYHFESVEKFYENLEILLSFVSVPYFTEESVAKEQGIIGQEIRMTEDTPDYMVYFDLMKLLFRNNPARDSVAGTVESIAEITADTLYRCHKIFYNPSNMALCVAGDVDPERVLQIARRVLPEESGSVPKRDYGGAETREPTAARAEREMEVSEPIYLIGASAAYPDKGADRLKTDLVGALTASLLAGRSSPLYLRLYREGLVKSDFSAGFESTAGVAYSVFGGTGRDPDAVLAALREELARVSLEGPDAKLLARVKKAAFGRQLRALDSFDDTCYAFVSGYFRGFDFFRTAEVLEAITPEDVRAFLRENLKPENLAVSVVRPKAEASA
ncbi:MAG: insulinase family protein [Oscillospiraceae bacterium]|jgi:predicted Zn-dependent peptidase|nr:insulinase family protein [Oscillospiraceae bacterium]